MYSDHHVNPSIIPSHAVKLDSNEFFQNVYVNKNKASRHQSERKKKLLAERENKLKESGFAVYVSGANRRKVKGTMKLSSIEDSNPSASSLSSTVSSFHSHKMDGVPKTALQTISEQDDREVFLREIVEKLNNLNSEKIRYIHSCLNQISHPHSVEKLSSEVFNIENPDGVDKKKKKSLLKISDTEEETTSQLFSTRSKLDHFHNTWKMNSSTSQLSAPTFEQKLNSKADEAGGKPDTIVKVPAITEERNASGLEIESAYRVELGKIRCDRSFSKIVEAPFVDTSDIKPLTVLRQTHRRNAILARNDTITSATDEKDLVSLSSLSSLPSEERKNRERKKKKEFGTLLCPILDAPQVEHSSAYSLKGSKREILPVLLKSQKNESIPLIELTDTWAERVKKEMDLLSLSISGTGNKDIISKKEPFGARLSVTDDE